MSGPSFEWKLRELMAMRGMFNTSDLIAPLADRGIHLSRSQVYRLVAESPERISLSMLLALIDILGCQLTELAVPGEAKPTRTARRTARRKAAGETATSGKLPPSAIPQSFFER
jgi:DNA-binding Xre family transcriptional regulator